MVEVERVDHQSSKMSAEGYQHDHHCLYNHVESDPDPDPDPEEPEETTNSLGEGVGAGAGSYTALWR